MKKLRNYIFKFWYHYRLNRWVPEFIKQLLRKWLGHTESHPVFPFEVHYSIAKEHYIDFTFFASPKMGEKAQRDGVENIITRAIYQYACEQKDGLILDIGMNYGFLSTAWAKALPQHQIIGFEVSPLLMDAVRKTIHKNHFGNFIIEQLAVSNQDHEALRFQLLPGKATRSDDASSSALVHSIRIDTYIQLQQLPLIAMKIDTDGFDYEVLLGADQTISTQRPMVVVETNHDPRIIQFFLDKKYFVYSMKGKAAIEPAHDILQPEFTNILCYPNPK